MLIESVMSWIMSISKYNTIQHNKYVANARHLKQVPFSHIFTTLDKVQVVIFS